MEKRDIGEVFELGSTGITVEVRQVSPEVPCRDINNLDKKCIFAFGINGCALKNKFEDDKRYIDYSGPCGKGTQNAVCFIKALPLIPVLKTCKLKCIKALTPDFIVGNSYKAEVLASSKMYKIRLDNKGEYAYLTADLIQEHFTEDEALF